MKRIFSLCLFFLAFYSCFGAEDEIQGKITAVIDGNTVEVVAKDNERYKVYLHGIDSPEPGQQYAEQARLYLEKLVLNRKVTIRLEGKDRMGNRLGRIYMKDGTDPRTEMLKAGLAWTTEKQPLPELENLRLTARAQGRGLWSEANPTPPWTWRRQQSMLQPKVSG